MRPEGSTAKAVELGLDLASRDPDAVPRENAGLDSGTLISLLAKNAETHGSSIAVRERDRGIWQEFTWSDVLSEVLAFAAALEARGFRAGDGILVIGRSEERRVGKEGGCRGTAES